jgi:hypothetical protein
MFLFCHETFDFRLPKPLPQKIFDNDFVTIIPRLERLGYLGEMWNFEVGSVRIYVNLDFRGSMLLVMKILLFGACMILLDMIIYWSLSCVGIR